MTTSATDRVRVIQPGPTDMGLVHVSGNDQDGMVLLPALDAVLTSR